MLLKEYDLKGSVKEQKKIDGRESQGDCRQNELMAVNCQS
jgi:hypothetical protein